MPPAVPSESSIRPLERSARDRLPVISTLVSTSPSASLGGRDHRVLEISVPPLVGRRPAASLFMVTLRRR
jgi:hypothetical protein